MSLDGTRVLLSRRDLDMNQDTLADLVGVSQAYISGVERGKITNPTLEVIIKLADALAVSPAYLLGLSDDPLGLDSSSEGQVVFETEDPEERRLVLELVEELQGLESSDQRLALSLIRQIRRNRDGRIVGA